MKMSNDEVTVYLSNSDLEHFDINPAERVPQSGDLHKFLYAVMEAVRTETGFDPYHGGQVMVEASLTVGGMMLVISKLTRTRTKKKITKEQFKRAKSVKVGGEQRIDTSEFEAEDIQTLLKSLGIHDRAREKQRAVWQTFVFNAFSDMEDALSLMPPQVTDSGVLYRENKRYALTLLLKHNTVHYNILSEYADVCTGSAIVARSIREGWQMVAEGEQLTEMADAVRSMK